jgi:hypothetical protein
MNEAKLILEQYDQTMTGDAWYGDPVWKILGGIEAECAAARPLAGAHSIWQLVMHMRFWERVAVQRAAGPVAIHESLNFPEPASAGEEAWQIALDQFRDSNREFRDLLTRIDAKQLDRNTPGGHRPLREELVGIIHHHIYHAGQIALLKKARLQGSGAKVWE